MIDASRLIVISHLKLQFTALLMVCTLTAGCAVEKFTSKIHGDSVAVEQPLDLVSILAKFAELDVSSPVEKFEVYFKTKVKKYPHPKLADVLRFEGAGYAATVPVSSIGSIYKLPNDNKERQSAIIQLPFTGKCIPPEEMKNKIPKLVKSNHYGASAYRHDDTSIAIDYMGYSISNKYGYAIYNFEDDECLREILISQEEKK